MVLLLESPERFFETLHSLNKEERAEALGIPPEEKPTESDNTDDKPLNSARARNSTPARKATKDAKKSKSTVNRAVSKRGASKAVKEEA